MALARLRRRRQREEEFVEYYRSQARHLRRTAYLLCGDWHLAEDLTQTALTKLFQSWSRIENRDAIDGYARRVLLRVFLDERRRPWRREYSTEPGSASLDRVSQPDTSSDERARLRTALGQIPRQRRAVLVLRFWMDLSIDQTADLLGCSAGTVRSQASRGLNDLRQVLGRDLDELPRTNQGRRTP
ncbi:SigE family RNA polymerase sigma factor [Micromonospora chersina]|uniref:SigE family RNA polymerase sigma factor n=1 Tax=Micromonospora chersina TaxID=47854 RepID=UPI003712DE93